MAPLKPALGRNNWLRSLVIGSFPALAHLLTPAAYAQESASTSAPFCVERPGQTTPPCVLGPGDVMVETGLADWTRDGSGADRVDQISLGASSLRFGIAPRLEVQFGWAGLVQANDPNPQTMERNWHSDRGDLSLGVLYGLLGQEGPVAVQAFATLPTGSGQASAQTWSAGFRLPVAAPLTANWQWGLTPEFDLAANMSGHGHHPAYGGAAGLSRALSDTWSAGLDVSLMQDDDPAGSSSRALASASLAWQVSARTQFDIGAGFGLTHASPGVEIYIGFARRL